MSLKQRHHYAAIMAAALFALLLVGGAGLFVAHLLLAGEWSGNLVVLALMAVGGFFFFLYLFVLTGASFSNIYGFFWRERTLRAAAQGDSGRLSPSPEQPDPALALRPGETLTLERRRGLGPMLAFGGFSLLFLVLITLSGEVIVFALLPTFGHSALNPLSFPRFARALAPAPSLLDWLTAAYPLVVSLVFLDAIPALLAEQRYTLLADDEGLTIRQSWHHRRLLPWNDIALFIQTGTDRTTNVTVAYVLWGREQQVSLLLVRLPQADDASRRRHRSVPGRFDTYHFVGGFERYAADTQRLLATIVARGHVPLQIIASLTSGLTRVQQRFPQTLTVDALLAAPRARQELQPRVQDASPVPSAMTLRGRLPIHSALLWTVIWFIVVSALSIAGFRAGLMQTPLPDLRVAFLRVSLFVVVVVILLAISALMAIGIVLPRRLRGPLVIADAIGLTRKTEHKRKTVTIPWTEMRAWAIKLSPDHLRTTRTYIVCSERATLTWTERGDAELAERGIQGDRRQAYQERAEQLHRLIAVRTGLPLREMTSQRPYVLQVEHFTDDPYKRADGL